MDAMSMMRTAAILFALAALGGLLMAGIRFGGKRNPPAWLAMGHGLLAAAGLTLLVYAACVAGVPPMANLAIVLFLLAASGGAVLSLAYKWKQILLPAWLVVVHALAAVAGFLLLLMAAFAG